MSFLFRFLKVLFLALISPRATDPFAPSRLNLRVWPNDLDLNVHVNNGRYLTLMDLGRLDLMMRNNGFKLWFGRGWQPLVALSMTRHFKALKVFQPFVLSSQLLGWDEKWIYFEQRFESRGKLYCVALVRGLLAGAQGPIPTAQLLQEMKIPAQPSPELPSYVKDWIKAEGGIIAQLKSEASYA
jgi:acyl-CoA thioesterase FadM